MLKISLLFTKNTNFTKIFTIRNTKFLGYYFYRNLNIQGDFQICISVPLNILEHFLCWRSYQIYVIISCRCQSKLQLHSNRLVMGCSTIKQNCSINSQTCFILTQDESSQQKKQPLGDMRENFTSQHGVFSKISHLISEHFYFAVIILLLSTKRDLNGFFSHLNRFKIRSSLKAHSKV